MNCSFSLLSFQQLFSNKQVISKESEPPPITSALISTARGHPSARTRPWRGGSHSCSPRTSPSWSTILPRLPGPHCPQVLFLNLWQLCFTFFPCLFCLCTPRKLNEAQPWHILAKPTPSIHSLIYHLQKMPTQPLPRSCVPGAYSTIYCMSHWCLKSYLS